MNNSIKMIILIIKFFFAKIKHLQNKKISSKFVGKSECPPYTHIKHYGSTCEKKPQISFFFYRKLLVYCCHDTRHDSSQFYFSKLQSRGIIFNLRKITIKADL